MDTDFIENLIALMRRHGVAELEYDSGATRLRLCLAPSGDQVARTAAPAPGQPPAADPPASQTGAIHATMAGCFYRAPAPDAPPFVELGQSVAAGDTLALLEAMKMLTPVEAEQDGTVAEIHVENGQSVARGDLLITLRAAD